MQDMVVFVFLCVAIVLPSSAVLATTMDDTVNTAEVPPISLPAALAKSTAALGTNAQYFVCTSAISKRKQYGGGWGVWFRSASLNTRYIHITGNGQVAANNEASPKGGQIKVPPALSMQGAVDFAMAQFRNGVVLSAVWIDAKDEWQVRLSSGEDKEVTVIVDAKGRVSKTQMAE